MSSFYDVAKGHKTGIFTSWNECKTQIDDFENPIYKKFDNIEDATEFIDEIINTIYIYTDGACINNGKKEAKAGIGIYFGKENPNNVSRELHGDNLTNNIAELTAIIEAILIIKSLKYSNKRRLCCLIFINFCSNYFCYSFDAYLTKHFGSSTFT